MCMCVHFYVYTHAYTLTLALASVGYKVRLFVQTTIKMEKKTKPGLHHCLLGLAEDPRSVLPEYTVERCSLASVFKKPWERMYPSWAKG